LCWNCCRCPRIVGGTQSPVGESTSYHQVLTYQPVGRYWTFQTYELAIFTGLGLILIGFCLWWTRHRIT